MVTRVEIVQTDRNISDGKPTIDSTTATFHDLHDCSDKIGTDLIGGGTIVSYNEKTIIILLIPTEEQRRVHSDLDMVAITTLAIYQGDDIDVEALMLYLMKNFRASFHVSLFQPR